MKVLVTGAAGYIGSHICKRFKSAGHTVIGIDRNFRFDARLYTDYFIAEDFVGKTSIYALEMHKPDVVIHCAAKSVVGPDLVDPGPYYLNNVAKTAILLEHIRRLPQMPVFVFSSSAAVYGEPSTDQIKETDPLRPINTYGDTKKTVEEMLAIYHKAYGLKSVSLRYFNVCGASRDGSLGQSLDAPHIITRLLNSVVHQEPFTLNGICYNTPDGTCIRDYIHIEDLVSAHLQAVDGLLNGLPSGALNLGSGIGISNKELVNAVSEQIGYVHLLVGQERAGDPARLVADINTVKLALDWRPKHSDLDTILSSSWRWLRSKISS